MDQLRPGRLSPTCGWRERQPRDGEATSYDEPPEGEFTRVPEPIESEGNAGPSDLLRGDDAESTGTAVDAGGTYMRQMDAVWSDGAPLPWIYDIKGSTD